MITDIGDSFEDYQNEIYPVDGSLPPFERTGAIVRGPLEGRIEKLASEGFQDKYRVDSCVDAIVPSDGFRAEKVGRWQAVVQKWKALQEAAVSHGRSLEKSNKLKASCFVTLALVGFVGTIAAAVLGVYLATIPFGFLMLGGAIGSAIYFNRASRAKRSAETEVHSQEGNIRQAERQIEKWSASPIQSIAQTRLDAYRQGFSAVYHNNAYRAVLIPLEVEGLYWQHFNTHMGRLQSEMSVSIEQKADWVLRFSLEHPFSRDVLFYVYGEIPLQFSDLSSDVERLKSILVAIEREYRSRQSSVDWNYDQAVKQIELERKTVLAPIQAIRDFQKEGLYHEKERELKAAEQWRRNHLSHPYWVYQNWVEEIRAVYHSKVKEVELQFSASATPMNVLFDQKVREQKHACTIASAALADEKKNELSKYFEEARFLNENIRDFQLVGS